MWNLDWTSTQQQLKYILSMFIESKIKSFFWEKCYLSIFNENCFKDLEKKLIERFHNLTERINEPFNAKIGMSWEIENS